MKKELIVYKKTKQINLPAVHRLFTQNELNDWFSLSDTEHYILKALFVASAWDGRKCVGLAVLYGDGRINVELDNLIVDLSYRKMGIASAIMQNIMEKIEKLNPYHFKVEVYETSTEEFYTRYGFRKNEGTWLLEHGPIGDKLHEKAMKIRQKRSQ